MGHQTYPWLVESHVFACYVFDICRSRTETFDNVRVSLAFNVFSVEHANEL